MYDTHCIIIIKLQYISETSFIRVSVNIINSLMSMSRSFSSGFTLWLCFKESCLLFNSRGYFTHYTHLYKKLCQKKNILNFHQNNKWALLTSILSVIINFWYFQYLNFKLTNNWNPMFKKITINNKFINNMNIQKNPYQDI